MRTCSRCSTTSASTSRPRPPVRPRRQPAVRRRQAPRQLRRGRGPAFLADPAAHGRGARRLRVRLQRQDEPHAAVLGRNLDLAHARYSGRRAPPIPGADPVTAEAYSHEVIAFGSVAGRRADDAVPGLLLLHVARAGPAARAAAGAGRGAVAGHGQRVARGPAVRRRPGRAGPGRGAPRVLRERVPRRDHYGGLGRRPPHAALEVARASSARRPRYGPASTRPRSSA